MKYFILFLLGSMLMLGNCFAQEEGGVNRIPTTRPVSGNNGMNSTNRPDLKQGGGARKDSLGFEHRDDAKDSITVSYRFFDSIRNIRIDSSINDFYTYFPIPASYQYMGNNGNAAYDIIHKPFLKPGWDAGFHAFDIYKYTLENTRFYKTTKPFTQLSYQLGSGKEQMIGILHTQNPRPNLNFGFEYHLISAPGFFVTQNTNHNNYRLFSNYQGKRKRYAAYIVFLGNALKSAENGGIEQDSLLYESNFKKRFTIPVNLGGAAAFQPNPFNANIATGNVYRDFTVMLRQQYDIGKKDSSIINDSTTEYLFFPKLRFQHTLTYSSSSYTFKDNAADSVLYKNWYDTTLVSANSIFYVTDQWKQLVNDFSLIQFPDTKNMAQYLLAGIKLENISGIFGTASTRFYNLIVHGEYKNKTRNKKWDILANGEFYLNGNNSGDYAAHAVLTRFLNKRWGNIRLSADNVNRTPSFIFNNASSFNWLNNTGFNKENITVISATAENPFIKLSVTNSLLTNYVYFNDYGKANQYSKVINLLQLAASKKFRLSKKWNWYTEVTIQQTDAAAPINVPLVYTRNRIAFEGLYYKNLNLSTGIEFRYCTPFKAYNYSPVVGKFMPQDSVTIRNLPDINLFLHFRIKSFTAYIRTENLNAISFKNGFGFTNNNFAAPHYVYPGFMFRIGIRWWFVN